MFGGTSSRIVSNWFEKAKHNLSFTQRCGIITHDCICGNLMTFHFLPDCFDSLASFRCSVVFRAVITAG